LTSNGSVITRTFTDKDFVMDNMKNTLFITASGIITRSADIPDKAKVYFLIRNDKTRNNPHMPRGTRVLAAYKSRINKNVMVVE